MNFLRSICITLLLVITFTPAVRAAEKVTYADHIEPILRDSCFSCHNTEKAKGGLDLSTYSTLMTGSSSGEIISPGDPLDSSLFLVIDHQEQPYMPPNSDKLPAARIAMIKQWIEGGALDTMSSKAAPKKKPTFDLALTSAPLGKPDAPPPLPQHLLKDPVVATDRSGAVTAIACNPWSPLIAVSGQHQVLLYHADTLEWLGLLPFPEGMPQTLRFSRNGSLLLAGGGRGGKSGKVVVWNLQTAQRIIIAGDEYDAVLGADIIAQQTRIALGGPQRLVRLYDSADGSLIESIKKHTDWVLDVAFSPDGVLLASGDRAGGLHIWESYTAAPFYSLEGHKGAITSLAWRDDANVLASASEDGQIKLWEMHNGKLVKGWGAHGGGVLAVSFSHDGRIASAGRDKRVKVWDQSGKLHKQFDPMPEIAMQAAFTHDGKRVVGADWLGNVLVWDAEDGKQVGELNVVPPALSTRIASAQGVVSEAQKHYAALLAAADAAEKATAEPAQRLKDAQARVAVAAKAVTEANKTAEEAKNAAALAAAQSAEAAKTRADKQKAVEAQAAALEVSKNQHRDAGIARDRVTSDVTSRKTTVEKLGSAATVAREAHEASPEDAELAKASEQSAAAHEAAKQSLAKAQEALAAAVKVAEEKNATMKAAEGALAEARKQFAAANAIADEKASVITAANNRIAKTQKVLEAATAAAAAVGKEEKQRTTEAAQQVEKMQAARQAAEAANEALKAAQLEVKRWEAERINVERFSVLEELPALQQNLAQVEANHAFAISQVEKAEASLIAARKSHADGIAAVAQAKQKVEAVTAQHAAAAEALAKAKETLAEKEKAFAAAEGDEAMAAATDVLEKTMVDVEVKQKALASATADHEAKAKSLADAEAQVPAALQSITAAEKVLADAKAQQGKTQKTVGMATKSFADMQSRANTLLTQYLAALPSDEIVSP